MEDPEKNPLSEKRTNNTSNTHMAPGQNLRQATLVGGERSYLCAVLARLINQTMKQDHTNFIRCKIRCLAQLIQGFKIPKSNSMLSQQLTCRDKYSTCWFQTDSTGNMRRLHARYQKCQDLGVLYTREQQKAGERRLKRIKNRVKCNGTHAIQISSRRCSDSSPPFGSFLQKTSILRTKCNETILI